MELVTVLNGDRLPRMSQSFSHKFDTYLTYSCRNWQGSDVRARICGCKRAHKSAQGPSLIGVRAGAKRTWGSKRQRTFLRISVPANTVCIVTLLLSFATFRTPRRFVGAAIMSRKRVAPCLQKFRKAQDQQDAFQIGASTCDRSRAICRAITFP